jgi:hypothetical protein
MSIAPDSGLGCTARAKGSISPAQHNHDNAVKVNGNTGFEM